MFVESSVNNGIKYLRLVDSVYTKDKDGKPTCRKKVIFSIGPLSKYDDGKPDYIKRLKESFKAGSPLIPELARFCPVDKKQVEKYNFIFEENDPYCIGNPKLFSHILIERILEEIGMVEFFRTYKVYKKLEFDILGFFRLLIYGRLLNPSSKFATAKQNDDYYDPIIDNPYEYNIYDTLDFIYEFKKSIFNRINKEMVNKFKRNTDLIFYDVTNFYFEIDNPDCDTLDDSGNILQKGVRKNGVCKEERKLPIVQMGMFMDNNGLPIAITTFPGNTLDHLTVIDSLKQTTDNMNFNRFIFIGDRGMCNYTNLLHLVNQGNGYIISKSIAKCNSDDKRWIYDQKGFIEDTTSFRYKSRIIHKQVKDEFGNLKEITEKQVVYWSKHFYDKQVHENRSFLDFIEKLKKTPENFRISTTQSKNLKRFLKNDVENINTGELLEANKLKTMIDDDKVNAFKEQMGYYQIISSETYMDDKEIISKYHKLSQIEDQFRVMKGDLNTRPLYVRTPEHIEAHLITCFIALTVLRIIQYKIKHSPDFKTSEDKDWEMGLSADRIIKALNKWTIDSFPNEYFRFNSLEDSDLKTILKAFDINIPVKLFKRGELKSLKTGIKI